jgi:hypothetical protein
VRSVLAGLAAKRLVGYEQVSMGGPSVRCAAGHLAVSKVSGRRSAMLCGEVELCGCLLAQPSRGLERLAQFQTLTSR